MAAPVIEPPDSAIYTLNHATVPASLVEGMSLSPDADGLALVDILVSDGRIARVAPAGNAATQGIPIVDLDRGMVLPCFVDAHTHLDKGHIWPRRRNPNGTFDGALTSVMADQTANWTADDVRRRMEFGLRSAYAHGTKAVRTHIDSLAPQHRLSWPVLRAMREAWAGRIEISASPLFGIPFALDPVFLAEIVAEVRESGTGVLGAVTYPLPELQGGLDALFRAAADEGFDLDFHVDETGDASVRTLETIAETALRHRFQGRILAGHCCSLAVQEAEAADRTLDLVAEAGIAVVSLPMCNMYLQDRRAGRTPRWRGVTLLHEMKARGITVAVASDNTRDPFYAYGDLDPLEVFREATRILHLDHPFGDWPRAVAADAADILRMPGFGRIAAGGAADLVLLRGRDFMEILARPESARVVLRGGKAIDRALPDYRELDDLMQRGA